MDIHDYMKCWDEVGHTDPLWGILSNPDKRGNKWDPEQFYATGTAQIDRLLSHVENIIGSSPRTVALDFGCGVGRLTRRLASYFQRVLGVDASPVMLDLARKNNSNYKNIEFVLNQENNLKIINDESVDFIYSEITLQHLPSIFQQNYISEFCRILARNGVLVFQTPSHTDMSPRGIAHLLLGNTLVNLYRRQKYGLHHPIEIHTIKRTKVEEILRKNGLTICKIDRYDSSGPGFVSFRYIAKKSDRRL